jgi:hypothetical protein
MVVRLATFNVENLFNRARALNQPTWEEGEPVLEAFGQFNALANKSAYTDTDKQQMLALLKILQVLKPTSAGHLRFNPKPFEAWALLRENRGDFIKQPPSRSSPLAVALGSAGWS